MKNVTDMAKPSAEQVTRCLNAIYDPITYRREIDYFRFRDNNQNLNVGGGVPWLTLEAVKLTHGFHSSNNGSCLWTMLANTLTDFYPNWREHIGGSYMVYSPKIWNMYQEAAVEYFKITTMFTSKITTPFSWVSLLAKTMSKYWNAFTHTQMQKK